MRARAAVVLAFASLSVASALSGMTSPATAGAPGTWSRISGSDAVSTAAAPSLARTSDGVLHVVYASEDGFGKNLRHVAVTSAGALSGSTTIHTGFDTMNPYPVLVTTSTGLRVAYGAFIADPPGNPYSAGYVYHAASDSVGSSWTVFTSGLLLDPQGYTSDGTGAVSLSDDTPVTAFARGSEIRYGSGSGATSSSIAQSQCCAYYATVVTDGSNAAVVWQGNGGTADSTGVFARQIHPGLGATTYKAPKSSTNTGAGHASSMSDQPTAAVQRNDGFTWIAYPVGYPTRTSVGLWRGGDTSAKYLSGSAGARLVALATGPSGRLWVAWAVGTDTVKLVRTAASGAAVGPVRTVKKPAAATGIYQIALDATYGEADLVINGGNGLYHTQVKPGLNFSASPRSWSAGTRKKVVFTVKDAGVAISGAVVKAKGKSCTTSTAGTCAITFPALSRTSFRATATKGAAYAPASLTLKTT